MRSSKSYWKNFPKFNTDKSPSSKGDGLFILHDNIHGYIIKYKKKETGGHLKWI